MYACGLSIKVVLFFACFLPFYAIRISGDDILRVCVCVCVCKCVCLPICCCLRVNLVFHSALHRSTSAAYVILGLCVYAPHTHTIKRKIEWERGRAPTRQPVSVCSLLSFACSFVGALSGAVNSVASCLCFFAWSYRSFSPMTVSCCRSLSLAFPFPNPSASRVGPPLVAFVVILLLLLLLLLFLFWAAATKRLSTVFTQLVVVVPLLACSLAFLSLSFRPPLMCLLPKSK